MFAGSKAAGDDRAHCAWVPPSPAFALPSPCFGCH